MYIKSLILDGFKSYGKRTEIQGFDREFTAITGLNGTGKSNILDSICFVLGISNLGQVRATSLQELVYKNGQAGITKATVTIIFDNSDEDNRPVGYEKCNEISVTRQIIVGGKNKYWINGKTVLNKKVTDLFCSIQMNVNNPNFLIMQGRITKVLNMKPLEILSMIEEASGTSLYETKREQTTKIIEKKDTKLKEMDSLLSEEVEPRIEKLREEQSQYAEFQKIVRDVDYLTHIHISYTYLQLKKEIEGTEKSLGNIKNFIENGHQSIENNTKECETIDEECKEMQKSIDNETGGALNDLEAELAKKSKTEATAVGAKKSMISEVETEKRKLKNLQRSINRDEEALQVKEDEMSKMGGMFQELQEADEADSKAYSDAQRRFQAVSVGIATSEDADAASLQEQLITAKTKASEANTLIKQSEMQLKHTSKVLYDKQNSKQTSDESYIRNKKKLEIAEAELQKLNDELSKIQYEEGTLEGLQQRRSVLVGEYRACKARLDEKQAHRFEVQYKDPEPNFNRQAVKGMLCKLFDVRDKKHALALSMCAGGRLHNLVVNNEHTSKLILERGGLQRRITIIPITKISGSTIPRDRIEMAQKLVGKENVVPAIDLIDYDPYLRPVMEYAFGRTFICKNMSIAKQITYHRNIMTRSITLDGDVLEPEGTLSGGSKDDAIPILLQVAEIKQLTRQADAKKAELDALALEIAKVEKVANHFMTIKEHLDTKQYEIESIKKLLATSSFQQHQQEIENAKTEIENLKETIEKTKKELSDANAKVKEVQANLVDAKGYRERLLKEAKQNMERLKVKSDESKKNWKKHEQHAETLKLEIQELKKAIASAREEEAEIEAGILQIQKKIEDLTANSATATAEMDALKRQIKEQKDSINAKHKELRNKATRKEKLIKQNDDLKLQIKKKENEMDKITSENKEAFDRVKKLEQQYKWIETDKEYFGVKNTKYDYSKENPQASGDKLRIAQANKAKMEKRINVKAMMLLEREEEQLKDVTSRRKIVENDRKKITGILKGLDAEKMEQVRNAWKEVDTNFGSIFNILLPGASASLVPSVNNDFRQGLNIRVGFNGVWKESLNELSGGQRSLVALSLILAMLKFKPAPIYILDEVDAALDMSHTQNIGNMLKTHFTNSQFIIVSLKDGMFNNANVLFKTKFENGVSAVTRTTNLRH